MKPSTRVQDLPDGNEQDSGSSAETFALPGHLSGPLFFFIQVGYLAMYTVTLYYLLDVENVLSRLVPLSVSITLPIIIVTAMCGIAVRLYLVSSVGWRHPEAGAKFERLFPALLLLDRPLGGVPAPAGTSNGGGHRPCRRCRAGLHPFLATDSGAESLPETVAVGTIIIGGGMPRFMGVARDFGTTPSARRRCALVHRSVGFLHY